MTVAPAAVPHQLACRRAAAAQGVAAAYLQLIEWVPLAPWNDLSRGNGQESLDIALALVSTVLTVGTWQCRSWARVASLVGLSAWLLLQVTTWWIPYLITGGSPTWRRVHEAWFARTVHFLPPIGDHPVPDAAHATLHLLLLIAVVTTGVAVRRASARRGPTA